MTTQASSPQPLHHLLRLPRAYLRLPLAPFVASPGNRQLLYYKLGLFFLLAVMAGAALTWQRSFLTAHLTFYCTYTLHLAFNYLLGIVLTALACKHFCPQWSAYERRTVARQWLIWGVGFLAGFLLHRLVALRLIDFYAPWLNQFLRAHPEASPSLMELFVFCGTAWLLATFAVIQTALSLQKHSARPRPAIAPAASAPAAERPALAAPAAARLSISHDGRTSRIPVARITHVTVEDHYCRIHYVDAQGPQNLFACMTLRSLAQELPQDGFVQIHRSHLVNLRHVSGLRRQGRQRFAALPGAELPISRHRWAEVQQRLPEVDQSN